MYKSDSLEMDTSPFLVYGGLITNCISSIRGPATRFIYLQHERQFALCIALDFSKKNVKAFIIDVVFNSLWK